MLTVGLWCSAVAALAIVTASTTMLRLTDIGPLWPAVGNAAGVVGALACLAQWGLWRAALVEWEGRRRHDLRAWFGLTRAAPWVSVVTTVLLCASAWLQFGDASPREPAWWLTLIAGPCAIMGTALAGVHSYRPSGPPH